MRLRKHQQWLYSFLYPFEMLQQYYFKMYFMIMVTELVIKLLYSVNFLLVFKLSPIQCFILWCYKKNENLNKSALCKCVGHCIMKYMLSHEAAMWRRDCGLSLWQGVCKQILSSSWCHSTVYFLPVRNAAPEHLLFMSHTFVLYFFLFCFFLYHRTAKKA